MDSSCSTPSSSRSRAAAVSRLPHHLQQPSSSTTGPAVHSPSVHNVRPGQCYVTVQTLSKESLVIVVNQKTRVHDVLWKCGEILEIAEDKLFGLALRQPTEGIGNDQPRHEYFFLDPAQKIVKYAPKQPRFANWHNRSVENRPLLVLYFRVRVYIDNDRLISTRDPRALEQYYLQLKDNFLDQWSGSHSVSEERCWEMAALSLRADKGDNPGGYFRAEQYFPMWVIDVRGLEYIRRNMPAVMEDLKDTGKTEAMAKFCQEASRSPFALNCHLYGLRRHKMDSVDNAVLGINARGIEMCDIGEDGERVPLRFLAWRKVTKFSFDRKKLTIVGADGTKTSMYAQNENKARYLLDLCRSVHQTLLVFSHKSATIAPVPQPFTEKCVDKVSTSSNNGLTPDQDADSLLHDSACSSGERLHGSVSSKQRIRVKLDSNLELKIEKMELEKHLDIQQDRATSQSSKTSQSSDKKDDLDSPADDYPREMPYTPPPQADSARPSSVDSASQTVDSGDSRQLDVNFNSKSADYQELCNGMMQFGNFADFQYPSSHGSRSDSVQQSHEALPEVMVHSFHHEQGYTRSEDDADSTLRSNLPPAASLSLHDLRPSGSVKMSTHLDPLHTVMMVQRSVSPNGKPRWTTVGGMMPTEHQGMSLTTGQARSEPRIDSDLWTHPSVSAALLDSPGTGNNGGRLFTKRTNSGASRLASSINRVRSMPAHYHVISGYQRSSPTEDYPPTPALQYAHSMNCPRPKAREPPSYDRAVAVNAQMQIQQTGGHGVPPPTCPLPAETPGGQPSFPPASATPTQFSSSLEQTYFLDEEALSNERLREFPLMHRLWKESHGLNHARRPSSCIDLSGDINSQISILPANGLVRGDYVLDTAPMMQFGVQRNNSNSQNSYGGFRTAVPSSAVVLPPPPPYPSSRKAPLVM